MPYEMGMQVPCSMDTEIPEEGPPRYFEWVMSSAIYVEAQTLVALELEPRRRRGRSYRPIAFAIDLSACSGKAVNVATNGSARRAWH